MQMTCSFLLNPICPDQRKHIISQVTSFKEGSFAFIYPGAPLSFKKLVVCDYDFLLSKISKKVDVWKGVLLLVDGKVSLTKSILFAILIHILSTLNPHAQVLKQIEKAFSHFLRGNFKGKAKKPWISWGRISNPIVEGGLDVRNLSMV